MDEHSIDSRMAAYEAQREDVRQINLDNGWMEPEEAPTLAEWDGPEPTAYDPQIYGPPLQRNASGALAISNGHRQFVVVNASMHTSAAFMAKQFGISILDLFQHFGETIEHASEISYLQQLAISHVVAVNPGIAPEHEEQILQLTGIERNDEPLENGAAMAKHWGQYFDLHDMPQWKQSKRPPVPVWYFDPPGLEVFVG